MGNAESNVTSGVKKQADTSSVTCYKLIDLKGGGLLVDLMKMAAKTRNYSEVDEAIRAMVKPYLYNGGAGKLVHVAHMVINRNKDRPKHKQYFKMTRALKKCIHLTFKIIACIMFKQAAMRLSFYSIARDGTCLSGILQDDKLKKFNQTVRFEEG
ncbi:hypothetical protein QYM36_009239 [Artemia franciscana]|uniref:Uncharacterized protein n=1 Tax=Artemia franciscana TaxID=6661 RepID=A0AA88KZF1_ARTSF|nr:hypothetical protein QYM36_009239 [Artemia franciscana]